MNRIRPLAIGFALVLTIALASSAIAQENKDITESGAVTGEVTAVDATSITVKGANDDGGTYVIYAGTQVMNDAKTIQITDVKKGWRVVVNWDYDAVNSKSRRAQLIEVVDAP